MFESGSYARHCFHELPIDTTAQDFVHNLQIKTNSVSANHSKEIFSTDSSYGFSTGYAEDNSAHHWRW